MRQSCFSLGFLSQYSLWKLSTFHGFEGYLYLCVFGMQRVIFQNRPGWRLSLVTWLSCEFKLRTNRMASLDFLSCNAPAGMTLQILHMLSMCATSGGLQAARSSRKSLLLCTNLSISSHSHTLPLHDSHLNTGLLIAKIQANLARNKANKMAD